MKKLTIVLLTCCMSLVAMNNQKKTTQQKVLVTTMQKAKDKTDQAKKSNQQIANWCPGNLTSNEIGSVERNAGIGTVVKDRSGKIHTILE